MGNENDKIEIIRARRFCRRDANREPSAQDLQLALSLQNSKKPTLCFTFFFSHHFLFLDFYVCVRCPGNVLT